MSPRQKSLLPAAEEERGGLTARRILIPSRSLVRAFVSARDLGFSYEFIVLLLHPPSFLLRNDNEARRRG